MPAEQTAMDHLSTGEPKTRKTLVEKLKHSTGPLTGELTPEEAVHFLGITPGHEGKQYKRVISFVRDPSDRSNIIGLHVAERE